MKILIDILTMLESARCLFLATADTGTCEFPHGFGMMFRNFQSDWCPDTRHLSATKMSHHWDYHSTFSSYLDLSGTCWHCYWNWFLEPALLGSWSCRLRLNANFSLSPWPWWVPWFSQLAMKLQVPWVAYTILYQDWKWWKYWSGYCRVLPSSTDPQLPIKQTSRPVIETPLSTGLLWCLLVSAVADPLVFEFLDTTWTIEVKGSDLEVTADCADTGRFRREAMEVCWDKCKDKWSYL